MKADSTQQRSIVPLVLLSFNLFIVMLGIGLVIPVLPFYIEEFQANAQTLGLLVAVFAFMQFLFAPIWGRLSDKIGRKPLITIGLFGFAAAEFIFAYAVGLWMLFLSRMLAGIFGSAIMPTAMAYVSDVTTPEKRGQGMGILGASMGFGIVVGPAVGGSLAEIDLAYPFIFAGIAATIAGIVSIFVLPESHSKEKRTVQTGKRVPQWRQMKNALQSPVGFLLILVFIMSFGLANFQAIFSYYALERFGYGTRDVGTILLITGVVGIIVQGVGVGRLTQKFGEAKVVSLALLISSIGFVIMTWANSFLWVIITTSFFFIGNSLLRPSLNSYISKLAGDQQGAMMGLNNSFLSLGNVIGPIIAGTIFEWNIHSPYILGAIIMFVGLIAMRAWLSQNKVTNVHSSI